MKEKKKPALPAWSTCRKKRRLLKDKYFYNIKRGNIRELATEILKVRGAKFQKKIVAIEIKSGEGIIVYPEQEVFGEVGE